MFRLFRRPAPPPTPSEAGKALSTRAHEIGRAERSRLVKAHCAAILASIPQKQEPAPMEPQQ